MKYVYDFIDNQGKENHIKINILKICSLKKILKYGKKAAKYYLTCFNNLQVILIKLKIQDCKVN